MSRARKIKGNFCERELASKGEFDRRSFRYKKSGKSWLLIGCPKGKWSAKGTKTVKGKRKKGRCRVGTRAHKILVNAPRGAACPVGAHRIVK